MEFVRSRKALSSASPCKQPEGGLPLENASRVSASSSAAALFQKPQEVEMEAEEELPPPPAATGMMDSKQTCQFSLTTEPMASKLCDCFTRAFSGITQPIRRLLMRLSTEAHSPAHLAAGPRSFLSLLHFTLRASFLLRRPSPDCITAWQQPRQKADRQCHYLQLVEKPV